MVTYDQIPTIDTQKIKRKEHKHNIKGNHQTTRAETKRRKKRTTIKTKK